MELLKFIPGSRFARAAYIGVLLFIPLVLLIPGWDGFVYSPRSSFSDLTISHYPNALFILDALRLGQFPLWSPLLFAGYPFAADPLSGLWYLPGWLALFFPLPLGLNLNLLIHLFFSGVGMFLFLRENKLDWLPALCGAMAWELMPKIFAHIGAGHLSFIYAVAWTPWLLFAEMKRENSKFSYWAGIILAVIVLADIRWAVYAGILWLAFSAWQWFFKNQYARVRELAILIKYVLISVLVAVIISASLTLPLVEFTGLSTRSLMSVDDNLSFSLSPIQLFGFLAPDFGGYAEWAVYFGGMFLLVITWILTHRDLRKSAAFWLLVLASTILLSLGAHFPPNQWLARLPGLDLLRVPSRFMVVFGFAGCVAIAKFLQFNPRSTEPRAHFWGNLFTAGIVTFSWIIVIGLWVISGSPPWQNLWGAAFLTAGYLFLLGERIGKAPLFYFQAGFMLLMVLDLGGVAKSNFVYIDKYVVSEEKSVTAKALATSNAPVRTYSPTYSLPQQTAARYRLETINGIDPLQLKSFVKIFSQASGIPYQTYSVTIPPFDGGEISIRNRDFPIDAQLMGWLNVKYIVSSFAIDSPTLAPQNKADTEFIYINQAFRPRAWMQADQEEMIQHDDTVAINYYSPNTIILTATGPGVLVLSEAAYPGWQVQVDGMKMEMSTIRQFFRGVNLSAGKHQVVFTYRPELLYLSLACAVCGWWWVIYQIWFSRSGLWHPQKKNGF